MACEKCKDLCVRFDIRHPYQLKQSIKIVRENIEDGTISEIKSKNRISAVTFSELSAGEPWDDIVIYKFRCNSCREKFLLHAETFHGSGGCWEPVNSKVIRKSL
jgi:hypothetical protein